MGRGALALAAGLAALGLAVVWPGRGEDRGPARLWPSRPAPEPSPRALPVPTPPPGPELVDVTPLAVGRVAAAAGQPRPSESWERLLLEHARSLGGGSTDRARVDRSAAHALEAYGPVPPAFLLAALAEVGRPGTERLAAADLLVHLESETQPGPRELELLWSFAEGSGPHGSAGGRHPGGALEATAHVAWARGSSGVGSAGSASPAGSRGGPQDGSQAGSQGGSQGGPQGGSQAGSQGGSQAGSQGGTVAEAELRANVALRALRALGPSIQRRAVLEHLERRTARLDGQSPAALAWVLGGGPGDRPIEDLAAHASGPLASGALAALARWCEANPEDELTAATREAWRATLIQLSEPASTAHEVGLSDAPSQGHGIETERLRDATDAFARLTGDPAIRMPEPDSEATVRRLAARVQRRDPGLWEAAWEQLALVASDPGLPERIRSAARAGLND